MPTFLDIIKANNADRVVGLIDETIRAHPELGNLTDARRAPGIAYETLVRVALGRTTGSFRSGNEGVDPIAHQYENRRVEAYLLEPRIEVDEGIANAYADGPEAYMSVQTTGALEGEMQGLSKCFYYGRNATFGNAKGFPGLLDAVSATMTVDAGGTTDNTATSVWFVKFGPQQVRWFIGQNGDLNFLPVMRQLVSDTQTPAKRFTALVQTMLGRVGLQVGSVLGIARIKKLTDDASKGLTDVLINKALATFIAGLQPDVCLMNRRAITQLTNSRTAVNPTGLPAPFPTSIVGIAGQNIPIQLTDAISNIETLAL